MGPPYSALLLTAKPGEQPSITGALLQEEGIWIMPGVKAALAWPNGKAYLFEKETAVAGVPGASYFRYDFSSGAIDQTPQLIVPNWPGLRPARPDAAAFWGFGKAIRTRGIGWRPSDRSCRFAP